jgi:nucleotide-binding universal stress UspA family protein
MYSKILVPLDGSEFAERALAAAIDLARPADAKIHLFTVLDGHLEAAFRDIGVVEHLPPEGAARAHLSGQAAEVAEHGISTTTAILTSKHAAEEIVREAETVGADLIVMTTHGRSGLRRWLLGSVAEKILRVSPIPVLLCPIRES